jgi:hypothetical protein
VRLHPIKAARMKMAVFWDVDLSNMIPKFQRIALMKNAASTCETSVIFYQTHQTHPRRQPSSTVNLLAKKCPILMITEVLEHKV